MAKAKSTAKARLKPVLALSTSWNQHRHSDGRPMAEEARELGFQAIELSHGIRVNLLPGILQAVQAGWLQVPSIHNFCPLPPGVLRPAPDLFQPSSLKTREREHWLRYTRKTLETAQAVGAKSVVIHGGAIRPGWRDPFQRIRTYIRRHPEDALDQDADLQRAIDRARHRSRRRADRQRTALTEALQLIVPEAKQARLRLGLENREDLADLPEEIRFGEVFAALGKNESIGYWHDTGHARIKARIGQLDVVDHLKSVKSHLVGWHLHDVTPGGRDHRALGDGTINWDELLPFFRPHHCFTLELGPFVKREDVIASRERAQALLDRIAA